MGRLRRRRGVKGKIMLKADRVMKYWHIFLALFLLLLLSAVFPAWAEASVKIIPNPLRS
jgi:hypothetical protein